MELLNYINSIDTTIYTLNDIADKKVAIRTNTLERFVAIQNEIQNSAYNRLNLFVTILLGTAYYKHTEKTCITITCRKEYSSTFLHGSQIVGIEFDHYSESILKKKGYKIIDTEQIKL